MGLVGLNRTFVYGDFIFGKRPPAPRPPGRQPFAVEILREFSTTEFVGKLFVKVGNSWLPATQGTLVNQKWYQIYQKLPATAPVSKVLFFEMEGSGIWQVQHLRDESDDSGPYIAVALKFGGANG
jgi:hypothetical protein